jgi:hypothetical protein
MQRQILQIESHIGLQDTDLRRLQEDTDHCLKFLGSVRDETAGLTTEMTENMRDLRTQVQSLKWRQEDTSHSVEAKVLECVSAVSVRTNQRLERGQGSLTDCVSELQGQVDELQETVRRRVIGVERRADMSSLTSQRLRSAELELVNLKRETQTKLLELEGSLLRRSRY